MKVLGIILIVLQVIAILGGGIPAVGGSAYAIGELVGFFFPGAVGVFLILRSKSKDQK